MAPCGPASPRRCPTFCQVARVLILSAAFAASIGILLPNAWATPATTTTTLTVTSSGSGVSSVASGTVVTLAVTVVSGSTPVNPGQVKFCDATAAHCEDSALLATAQLTTAGAATYKFRPGPGSHKYQAVFVGTTSYANSSSAASALTVTSPAKYPTTTAIASSGSPGDHTLTATVVGIGSSTLSPTGDVSFLDTTNGNASLGTAALGTATGGTGFTTGPTSATGSAPTTVEVGDFNGDGIPDLVTANSADNTMSVLLGNGDGTFTLKSSPAVGYAPYSFAIGDFNGDGILDMAVANCGDCSYFNYSSNTVTVLLGNGDGTFTTKSTLTVGTSPQFVAVGDFNGDGIPDLAVTNGSDNTVTVLLGNGDGTFTTKSTLAVGTAPRFLVVSDFNGDGIPDLAVANSGDSTVTVLLGNGDGTFSIKSTPAAAPSNLVLVVGDFNGDGIPDLATANYGVVTVLLGNGDGTFTAKTSSATAYYYVGIVVGDFNDDGILDLALGSCGHCGANLVPVLLGNGDGTFSTGPLLNTGYLPFSLAVADFNGDGTQDLASASFDDDTVTLLLNQITETATATLSNVSVSGTGTHLVETSYPGNANFNSSISRTVPLLTGQGATGSQTSTTLTVTTAGTAVTSVAAGTVVTLSANVVSGSTPVPQGQVNFCDASAEYCTGSHLLAAAQLTSAGTATYKFRPGIGSHSYQAVFVGSSSYAKSKSATADLTVTGLYPTTTTIAASGSTGNYTLTSTVVGFGSALPLGGNVSFLDTTNGNASLGTAALENSGLSFGVNSIPVPGDEPLYVAVGDFNGDGILDLATANQGDNTVTVMLGNGDGTFTFKSLLSVSNPYIAHIAVGDFNGDGIPDLAVLADGSSDEGTVTLLLGNGDGTFTTKSTLSVGNNPQYIGVGDFNGDGIPDLAVANEDSSTVTVLLGNGDGTFTTKSTLNIAGGPAAIGVGDFNGDGILDLAVANYFGSTVTVLLGAGDGTFTATSTITPTNNPDDIRFMVVGDFNGDGILDLAAGVISDGTAVILLGNGDGTFTTKSTPSVGGAVSALITGDFNGDGITDLASADFRACSTGVILGNGDGTFGAPISTSSGCYSYTVNAGDFNGDGLPDLVVGLQSYGAFNPAAVMVLLNQPSVATATLSNVSVSGTGTHLVEASYPGNANFSGSTSGTVALTTSSQTATTLNLISSLNPAFYGNLITLTATLSPISSATRGETVTFYNGGTSIGTGMLSNGVATLLISSLPLGTDTLTATYPGDANFTGATSNPLVETVTTPSETIPAFVVTTTTDTTTGVASNCTGTGSRNCSLRDALAAASANGSGNITFSPTAFAAAQTITLVNGGLSIPLQTTITGPTTGAGTTLKNLVTVSGGGPVFTVNPGVTNSAIFNLTITGGSTGNEGGGILNNGGLAVSNSTIAGNSADSSTNFGSSGGGIENLGTLTLIDSTVSGNSVSLFTSGCLEGCGVSGGGIDNQGTLSLINSTVSGNSASVYVSNYGSATGAISAVGGGINNYGTLILTNSTVASNSVSAQASASLGLSVGAGGGGIFGNVNTSGNSIISGNTNNGSEDDCDNGSGPSCPTSGQNGNIVGASSLLPLANYGGPTQTQPPLPGSPAICEGLIADIPAGTATDQRGLPRTTTYGINPPCVDTGAVQTNYSLSFSTEPPATTPATTDFIAAVQVKESGNAVPASGINIMTALAAGDNGSLNIGSFSTNSAGIASNSQFQISAPGNHTLVATLPLTSGGVTPVASVAATSTPVSVTPSSGIEVMVGVSPAGVTFMVDGVSYTAPTTLVWPLGSQHTLSAVSPQGTAGAQYNFASWSDGGSITHTVTASPSTINYTVTFNTSYLLTTSANPSQGGTVSPASGYFPANSPVILTATANPGYTFTNWTGNVTSNLPSIAIAMTGPQSATANFTTIPVYTVNTNLDDSTGTAANCTGYGSTCSLRDALAAASAQTSADILFDSTVFAASQPASARTIVLGSAAGTLNVSGNARILGSTTASGTTLTQLVTIDGENLGGTGSIFSTNGNVVLSGLAIVNDPAGAITNNAGLSVVNCFISGNSASQGGGISNGYGELTVMSTTISGNNSSGGGGGIFNQGGGVTVIGSLITGNSGGAILGGAFFPGLYAGTITIINSTITGNSGTGIVAQAGVEQSTPLQSLTIADSTISGNTGGAVLVQEGEDINTNNYIFVALTVTDSILSDCSASGTTCPTNGQSGNFIGAGAQLAPLADYGGPTQTQIPLPASPVICAGIVADIPAGVTTDQRGFPRTATYDSNPPCVDSGAVETHYALAFNTEPPAIVAPNTNFTAAVQLSEGGNPFPVSGITVPLVLGAGSTGSLSGGSAVTSTTGIAAYPTLQVGANGYGDTLVAMLPLTASVVTPLATASATSTAFDVTQPGSPVAEPIIGPPTGTYTSPQSVTITDTSPGAVIYYTTDGTTPSRSSPTYSGRPITVSTTQTIKALAVASHYMTSPEAAATYTIAALAPLISPPSDFYFPPISVTITDGTPNAVIRYTTDGTTPTPTSPVYGATFTVTSPERVRAIATAPNLAPSAVTSADFDVMSAAAEPIISLPSGTYSGPQMVMITDATPGAVIYYTTNGMTPSRSSAIYSSGSPIMVTSSQTIKALAVATGYSTSPEAVARYAITQ